MKYLFAYIELTLFIILPSLTITNPTLQTLERLLLAVSKSIAAKLSIMTFITNIVYIIPEKQFAGNSY